jgi:dTDP-4-amino-4,6-dideoxygalactose transaminase
MEHLRGKGVGACFHYIPLHTAPAGRKFAKRHYDLPKTDSASSRLLRLPLFCELGEVEIEYVAAAISRFFKGA